MKKIDVIIQARSGSTRLPGKIFKPLAGRPMLWHVQNRLKHSKLHTNIIIATTVLPEDDAVENFCISNSIKFHRGSSEDVLSRYYEAAKKYGSEIIIRITSDCPVIDPEILDRMIAEFSNLAEYGEIDYFSNVIERTLPRGLDIEIFTFDALEKSQKEAVNKHDREHVTPYIYLHPEIFKIKNFTNEKDYSFHRWCVDTAEDLKLLEEIYNALYSRKEIFLMNDILKLFDENPGLININKSVVQK